jgi:hypothetical protein
MKIRTVLLTARSLRWIALLFFAGIVFGLLWQRAPGSRAALPSKQAENKLPEMAPLPTTKIGLGQRLYFGIGAIDEEGDDVSLNLLRKPVSAKFDQNSLTVDWTPTKQDGPNGVFEVQVTEIPRDKSRKQRTFTRAFTIAIQKDPVQLLKVPPAPMEVDALVSIIDPARLAVADQQWPILRMFDQIAAIEADKQVKPGGPITGTTGAALFKDMLKNLAAMHHNETVDPDSPKYNPQFNAENWHLIAVRPRFNKRTFELRLVYFNVVAAEPIYVMPRMRIVRGKDPGRPEEQRQKNNHAFTTIFYDTFFEDEKLKPFVATDKKAYGEALAQFITQIVNYRDPMDPAMRANFAALPHNSRLGGGNIYDAKGKYVSGDGWALGAMKIAPVMRDGKQVLAFVSPQIDGFATSVKVNPAGALAPAPAPRFDPKSSSFARGWDALIDTDDHGNIAIPEVQADGSVRGSNVDSSTTAHDFRFNWQIAETPLRDTRRRIFEERGMTCIQCHVRNFDDGDMLKDARDPKGTPGAVRDIPRVFFVVVPTIGLGRTEFIRRNEEEQVAALQGVILDYLGITVDLHSPLGKTWPHDTRKGRS